MINQFLHIIYRYNKKTAPPMEAPVMGEFLVAKFSPQKTQPDGYAHRENYSRNEQGIFDLPKLEDRFLPFPDKDPSHMPIDYLILPKLSRAVCIFSFVALFVIFWLFPVMQAQAEFLIFPFPEGEVPDWFFAPSDSRSPIISNLSGVFTSPSTFRVSWDTDVPSTSYIEYATSAEYNSGRYPFPKYILDETETLNHVMVLTNLIPNEVYFYEVKSSQYLVLSSTSSVHTTSESPDSSSLTSNSLSFKTSPLAPPQTIATGTQVALGAFTSTLKGGPITIKKLPFTVTIGNAGNTWSLDNLSNIELKTDKGVLVSKGVKSSTDEIVFSDGFTISTTTDYIIRATLNSNFKAGQTITLSSNLYKQDAVFTTTKDDKLVTPPKSDLKLSTMTVAGTTTKSKSMWQNFYEYFFGI